MELKHIDIAKLAVSPANMRAKGKTPDIANILPSVRARGVLVPLIVRQNGTPDTYEIVAGKRRYHAALAVAEEGGGIEELPCAVIEPGDDAAALEASLIENIARLDPDEVNRWETFTRLVREGRSAEDIALTFGLTELQVERTLALGNLLPRIRGLYRAEQIDAVTVRHLTLASKARQREWLALLDSEDAYAPVGQQLKAWLFGGASISTEVALFDPAAFDGEIVADLFGEESYFADVEQFWAAQNAAIEERADAYRGWSEIVVLEPGQPFYTWEHERRAKSKDDKVYIAVGHRGEVAFHEGYVTSKEARQLERGELIEKPMRPEVTAAMGDYIDLHRHAALRAKLANEPGAALRVAVAHMIAGSPLWAVRVEPQRSANEAVTESVETSASETAFDAKRREVLALLGFDAETPTVTGGEGEGLAELFAKLAKLDDAGVMAILAVVMGETLDARSDFMDLLGQHLAVDMSQVWQVDDALLDLVRDREVLLALVDDMAGAKVAEANAKEKGKTLKTILRDCLEGAKGRPKAERWVPRWPRFPASDYTARGGVGSGDRIMFLRNERSLGVKNGSLGTVRSVDALRMQVMLDDGRAVAFDHKDYADIDHGYAATIHKAQGMTVNRVHVLATPGMGRHAAYVALSRHREQVDLHYGCDDFADERSLMRALSRERGKDMASDYAAAPDRSPEPAPQKRDPFAGLKLRSPTRQLSLFDDGGLEAPASARPTLDRAVERFARASAEIVKERQRGQQETPQQLREYHAARHDIDALRPEGARDLRSAFLRDTRLIDEAAAGQTRGAIAAMDWERRYRSDPRFRADHFVKAWRQLGGRHELFERRGDDSSMRRVAGQMAELAKSLERDPQLESLLGQRSKELGMPPFIDRPLSQALPDWIGWGRGRGLGR